MTDMSKHADPMSRIAAMAENLKAAQDLHEERTKVAEAARREQTDALNRVNQAQRAFDEALAAVRKSAPRDSDWHRFRQTMAGAGAGICDGAQGRIEESR